MILKTPCWNSYKYCRSTRNTVCSYLFWLVDLLVSIVAKAKCMGNLCNSNVLFLRGFHPPKRKKRGNLEVVETRNNARVQKENPIFPFTRLLLSQERKLDNPLSFSSNQYAALTVRGVEEPEGRHITASAKLRVCGACLFLPPLPYPPPPLPSANHSTGRKRCCGRRDGPRSTALRVKEPAFSSKRFRPSVPGRPQSNKQT